MCGKKRPDRDRSREAGRKKGKKETHPRDERRGLVYGVWYHYRKEIG